MTKKYLTYWRSVAHIMPLNPEQLWCVLAYAKAVNLRRAGHRSVPHSAQTVPAHTPLAMTTDLQRNAICNGCSKRGHWHAKCCSSGAVGKHAAKFNGAVKASHHQCWEKGKRADIAQVSTKETPPCDELFANAVHCGTAGDTHPEDIVIDDICAPGCNEAYTMVKLPASINSKGTASLHVKVDTGAGGNVLPLHEF